MADSRLSEAVELWNVAALECGWPTIRRLTADRERKVRSLIREGLDDWREALAKAKASDFLCGRTARSERHAGWRFSFDFFITESRFVRVLEGQYDNAQSSTPSLHIEDPETLLWRARLKDYKPGGMWLGIWGPRPGENGCQAPTSLVTEWQQKNAVH
jgi:hypothetical protein